MGLIPQSTFAADVRQWQRISSYIMYQQDVTDSTDFYPSNAVSKMSKVTGEEAGMK